ncbi:MAG: DNA methylase, partial [Bacteroidetes bacterium]|nr:DNA methylase [Bacteroidota bacterium]
MRQDLVISCYKPSSDFDQKFRQNQYNDVGVWDFVEEHLHHLPVHLLKDNSTTAIIERSPKILFDRLVAFYVQRSLPVPIDAGKFQIGLKERFVERNGMYFTAEQAAEYDRKKAEAPNFVQAALFVSSEQDGVLFLKNLLEQKPLTYAGIHPHWMQ